MNKLIINLTMKKIFVLVPLLFLPLISLAVAPTYTMITGIPGVDPANTDFGVFINSIYALSIAIAALLAVIKIIIAGVKWMMTDVVTSKSEARSDIEGALLGLLVVLSAVLILTIVNSQIVNFNFDFQNLAPSEKGYEEDDGEYEAKSNNAYDYLTAESPYVRKFFNDCVEENRYFQFIGDTARCLKASTITQDYLIIEICRITIFKSVCTADDGKNASKQCDSKNGTFLVDEIPRNDTRYGYCFYDKS
jgi:hypothetical protein